MGYDSEKIGQRIFTARNHLGMKQSTLSKRAGISQASLSNIENGVYKLRVETLYKIAEALNVPVSWILDEDSSYNDYGLEEYELVELKKYADYIISRRE
jgi:transcriptional regulator with XRE-family HTH domain